jgi:hypothetical protein
MSATFNPVALLYAVVEYLKSSEHVYDPVVSSQKVGAYPCGRPGGQAQGAAPTANY